MFQLKPLSKEAVPAALEKAMRYRLLNEPGEAESICHDILAADPDNQEAMVLLLLAITDRFGRGYGVGTMPAQDVLAKLRNPYEKAYYAGIIHERRAKAKLRQANPGSGFEAYESLREAMDCFEKAEKIRPQGNDDSLLHWNACARIIMQNKLGPRTEEKVEMQLE